MTETVKPQIHPIANSCSSVTLTGQWFLQGLAEPNYQPSESLFTPLINGEKAFGEVHEAIANAKQSVDIICWGFQPSMYLKRNGDSQPPIGELLSKKALVIQKETKKSVTVRVLCWSKAVSMQKLAGIDNMSTISPIPAIAKPDSKNMSLVQCDYKSPNSLMAEYTTEQLTFNLYWYRICRDNLFIAEKDYLICKDKIAEYNKNPRPNQTVMGEGDKVIIYEFLRDNEKYKHTFKLLKTPPAQRNILFTTRSVDLNIETIKDLNPKVRALLTIGASHHQKTVLIDYDYKEPKKAVGFVMEHNLVDNYWDTNEHLLVKNDPSKGKNVCVPWQDVSSKVQGGVLFDLNHNFTEAWTKATKAFPFPAGRNQQTRKVFTTAIACNTTRVFAQILRTQPDYNEVNIERLYIQNISKPQAYIYTENQYFRNPDLITEQFKSYLKNRMNAKTAQPICWFVVTNSHEDAIKSGGEYTFTMLDKLGRGDVLPELGKRVYLKPLEKQEQSQANKLGNSTGQSWPVYGITDKEKEKLIEKSHDKLAELKQQKVDYQTQSKNAQTKLNKIHPVSNNKPSSRSWYNIFGKASDTVSEAAADVEQWWEKRSNRNDPNLAKHLNSKKELAKLIQENDKEIKKIDTQHQQIEKDLAEYQETKAKIDSWKPKPGESEQDAVTNQLKKDMTEEGIRVHICTIVSPQMWTKHNEANEKTRTQKFDQLSQWQEVYIHSKVTVIDDTFLTMGSANLNYRSMKGDSELNIVLECDKVAHKMRFDLWKLHTSPITRDKENGMPDSTAERENNQEANPSYHWKDNCHNPKIANQVFGEWQSMLRKNRNKEQKNEPPQQPLREFYNSTTNWSSTD